jgi:hypothetical protein
MSVTTGNFARVITASFLKPFAFDGRHAPTGLRFKRRRRVAIA